MARTVPAVMCDACRGWVDRDGSVMTAAETVARYPELASVIDRGRYERVKPSALTLLDLSGRLAGNLLGAIFAAITLACLIVLLVLIVKWAT